MNFWVNWNMSKFFRRKVISASDTINAAAIKPSLRTLSPGLERSHYRHRFQSHLIAQHKVSYIGPRHSLKY